MKKAVSLFLVLLMLGAFAACAGEEPASGSKPTDAPVEKATEAPAASNEYVGKTFAGQGMSVSDSSGAAHNIVDVELTVVDGEKCDVVYPVMTFTPTFTVAYTLEGNRITLGECLSCAPSEAFAAS